jgi:uncharacterized membrane protein YcaP (DUF421 family)
MDMTLWINMFQLGLPILEKILRPIIVYAFLVIGLRLAGKRELAQLNPFDLVVLLTLSNAVQNAIIGDDNSVTGGIIGGATLLVVNYIVVRSLANHQRLKEFVAGQPDELISHGNVQADHLKKELITMPELEEAARKQGFESLAEVDCAELEPSGAIAFIAKEPTPEEARHQELMARLNQLTRELAEMRSMQIAHP